MTTMTNQPIVNLPFLYVNNLQVSWTTTKTLTVASGQCRDSTNSLDIVLSNPIVINGAANGVNGLDTGTLANNTWYGVFMIADPAGFNQTATILSASFTTPTLSLAAGYGTWRLIGFAKTDSSANFLKFILSGSNASRYFQLDTPIRVLAGGSATSFTAVPLTAAPTQSSKVYLNFAYTPALATNSANIRPTGSTATAGSCPIALQNSSGSAVANSNMVGILPNVVSGNPSVDYVVTSGDSLSIAVAAFEYVI
jgi:hypothetical protein